MCTLQSFDLKKKIPPVVILHSVYVYMLLLFEY